MFATHMHDIYLLISAYIPTTYKNMKDLPAETKDKAVNLYESWRAADAWFQILMNEKGGLNDTDWSSRLDQAIAAKYKVQMELVELLG